MTIEISSVVIPIGLNLLLLASLARDLIAGSKSWMGPSFEIIILAIGSLFIWLAYFAAMYFLK